MKTTQKKPGLILSLTVAILAALAGKIIIDQRNTRLTADQPNYSLIEDGLYMGGRVAQPPPDVRAVLNLSETQDYYTTEIYRWQPIPDAAPAPTLNWLRAQVDFITAQRRAGRTIFIHCDAGISRSGLVTTAYLMQHHHQSRDDALRFIRTKREVVRPRSEFMTLLMEWEKSLQPTSAAPATPRL